MPTIIGIAGKIASGKGVAAEHIVSRHHAGFIDYSQFLYRVLDIFAVSHERKNINALSIFLRATYGQGVFNNAVLRELGTVREDIVVVAGIRRDSELDGLREIPGFSLIYVDSDIHARYGRNRMCARKPGDAEMSFEQFAEKDSDDSNNTIEGLKQRADYVIENNGALDEFLTRLDQMVSKFVSK
jgi:dephospho-CoA kinase